MAQLPSGGVPQLLLTVGDGGAVVRGAALYSGADHVLRAIADAETRLRVVA